jgi:HEPN domain-containing protein
MRPREQVKRRILEEWLHKARTDITVAELLISREETFPNVVAFHSQQAAEKFIKAFLAWAEIEFPKTHDIAELLVLVAIANEQLAADLREAKGLTPYGVDLRYPTDRPDASPEDAREAVRLAKMVRDAVLPLLPNPPGGADG